MLLKILINRVLLKLSFNDYISEIKTSIKRGDQLYCLVYSKWLLAEGYLHWLC